MQPFSTFCYTAFRQELIAFLSTVVITTVDSFVREASSLYAICRLNSYFNNSYETFDFKHVVLGN